MMKYRLCITGVPSFMPDGKIAYNVGTSFSTPWVSRMAGELSYLMNEVSRKTSVISSAELYSISLTPRGH